MAVTQNTYTGNGSTVLYSFTFPYLATTDVKVKLNGSDTTAYSLANATTVQMNSAPANGDKIIIYRNTDNDNKKATFYPGSAIKAEDLNDNYDQILYTVQEVDNNAMSTLGDTAMQGDFLMGSGFGLQFEGATTDDFETRLIATDPTQDNVINLPNASGTLITSDDYPAVRAAVEAASDSNVFTDADHSKLNNIEANATQDQTADEIRSLVESATDSNVFTDADHTKLNNIESNATADQSASEIVALIADQTIAPSEIDMEDNERIKLGTGDDLQCYHTGSDSRIVNNGSDLYLYTTGDYEVKILADSQNAIVCKPDGAVEHYYDNSKKFETTSTGAKISGTLLDINTTSANSAIVKLQTNVNSCEIEGRVVGGENHLILSSNNSVDSLKITGTAGGTVQLPNDNQKLQIGAGQDLEIYHDGSNSYLLNATGEFQIANSGNGNAIFLQAKAGQNSVRALANGATELYFDNQLKAQTYAHGWSTANLTLTENAYLADNKKVFLGDGDDLQLYHDGSHSYIDDSSNELRVKSALLRLRASNDDAYITCVEEGAVNLYYDNNKKFETISAGAKVTGNLKLSDNGQLQIGDATNGDLVLLHDATDSIINNATGNLVYRSATHKLQALNGHDMLVGNTGGSVELYHNNSKKLETYANGIKLGDNVLAAFGNDIDLLIHHTGSTGYIKNQTGNFYIQNDGVIIIGNRSASTAGLKFNDGGALELYFDNSKKFETTSGGVGVSGFLDIPSDSSRLRLGASNDLQIYHNGTVNYIEAVSHDLQLIGNSSKKFAVFAQNGAAELYYDGNKKLETTDYGVAFVDQAKFDNNTNAGKDVIWDPAGDQMRWTDNTKATFGSSSDLQIYHDGTNSYILDNGSGHLNLKTNGTQIILTKTPHANLAVFNVDGSNELYYAGNKKLETTTNGVTVTGSVTTQDINMSNLNASSGNEVDGTKGNWTMQEGESDLFLINRISGKKYKFNLTEIN